MNAIRYFSFIAILGCALQASAVEAPTQITFSDGQDADPAVSPDGKQLAFSSDRTGGFCLYLTTFGEAGVVQLTQTKQDDRRPSWSADGAHILFDSKRTGNKDLYEIKADGSSGFLQLTDSEAVEESATYVGGGLLFASQPKKTFRVRDDFKVVRAAEKGRAANGQPLADGGEPRLAPDGSKIVFVSNRTKNKDLWIMNADGGLQTQLTTDPKDDENPCFSPDGKQVVFASKRTGTYDLWVMNVDGTNQRQLTSGEENDTQPSWSTTGHIYFTRAPEMGKSNIYRISAP